MINVLTHCALFDLQDQIVIPLTHTGLTGAGQDEDLLARDAVA